MSSLDTLSIEHSLFNLNSTEIEIIKRISIKIGITVVIITHEMSVIEEVCQRVAIIDNSKIAEIGTVEKIFTAPKSSHRKTTCV